MIVIFRIITQLIYLILVIYFQHEHHVEVDQSAYKDSRDIMRLVIPRLENADKMPKLNPRINLGISSDLGIAIPRFNPS